MDPSPGDRSAPARALSVAAIALGLASLAILPVLLGPAGLVCGYAGLRSGDRLGAWGMVVAGIGTVVGVVVQELFAPAGF